MNVLAGFKKIRAFVFDVDGVLTDGSLLVMDNGQLVRRMNIKDGYALQLAIKQGYDIMVISGGNSEAVRQRLEKLGVHEVHMNILNKKDVLTRFVTGKQLKWEEVLYMGDDIPDLEVMQLSGLPCCPAVAVQEIRAVSHFISQIPGGQGCVREVIEKVLRLQGKWSHDVTVPSK